jgi:hypothetical protein
MLVTPAVLYLFIGLAGCSVDPGINNDARKLVRTPRVIKKNNNKVILIIRKKKNALKTL